MAYPKVRLEVYRLTQYLHDEPRFSRLFLNLEDAEAYIKELNDDRHVTDCVYQQRNSLYSVTRFLEFNRKTQTLTGWKICIVEEQVY